MVVPLYIAVTSVLLSWGVSTLLVVTHVSPPWWFGAPSVIGFYGLFYGLFDRYIWKCLLARTIRLVQTPDLNGTWHGHCTSSFDDHAAKKDATLTIRQTWTGISVQLETARSKSTSSIAGVLLESATGVLLCYEYLNEPLATAGHTMHTHRGAARLYVRGGGRLLEGDYYTGRDRQTVGVLKFERAIRGETTVRNGVNQVARSREIESKSVEETLETFSRPLGQHFSLGIY